ncbi:sigma-70 family RNA polymerase sigma factor [Nocardia caishijiensis]|uniref:RNA polymerase sigma factor (Sigma-70 family) n=1 Tax=Nocardia caishijiensis TaxID=184756 RepID=A0ABQ6YMS0_9NOCA|nr:sigma-70 family RNA polymerase sigma factor [Nocardia caishijiensis]KAF0847073.1 RNA polymerase sigma factor (sigma-70 family) [Nocardia caishijiensis]
MTEDDKGLEKWLGRTLSEVPESDRLAVMEYVVGESLVEVARYLVVTARYELRKSDPSAYQTYEDLAQEVLVSLFDKGIPEFRLTAWRAYLLRRTRWKIQESRASRTRQKNDERLLSSLDEVGEQGNTAAAGTDFVDDLVTRDRLEEALAELPDAAERAVLRATFAMDEHGFDLRTTREVADILGVHVSKVKRLRSAGTRRLRELLQNDVDQMGVL